MDIYILATFEEIAAAIGMNVTEIAERAPLFEAAARWYRLDGASPKRTPASLLQRKLDQIAKNSRRLLRSLDIVELDDALDGPGDPQILDALILRGDDDATPITRATQRIARLAEIMEGVAAAVELSRRAEQATADVARVGEITVEAGNCGDIAINDWLATMLSVYKVITGDEPATSVGGPNLPDEDIAGGPLIRFLIAASKPLRLKLDDDAWRSRVRKVLKGASLQD